MFFDGTNILDHRAQNMSRMGSRASFFNINFGPRAKNIDFGDKFLIATDIIFLFYGVLPFNILLENGQFSQKWRF